MKPAPNIPALTLLFVLGILLQGCTKDRYTLCKALLINPTDHKITILPYKAGQVPATDTLRLKPQDSIVIADGSQRGERNGPGFSSKYFGGPADSNVVIFDDSFRVVHYVDLPDTPLAIKHYLYHSLRNLSNIKSYELEQIKQSKHVYENIHRYYFTEADYDFARD
jgi:hypothetical protein